MKSFFPMPGKERTALFALVVFSAVAFLPIFGELSVLGVAVFGWLMAALLLGSPAILLLLLLSEPRSPADPEVRPEADTTRDP